MLQYLDKTGLTYFWSKVKAYADAVKSTVGGYKINGKAINTNPTISKSDVGLGNVTNDAQVKRSEMGAAGGVATLGTDGIVPSSQLPSYVDDVVLFDGFLDGNILIQIKSTNTPQRAFYSTKSKKFIVEGTDGTYYPSWTFTDKTNTVGDNTTEPNGKTPEAGKIYVDSSTNKTYRWSGSTLVEISASIALGTTSSTAFPGDKGQTAYNHATAKGAAFGSGFYKITTNAEGHVTAATAVTKADITALGLAASSDLVAITSTEIDTICK